MARSLCGQIQSDLRSLSNAAAVQSKFKPVKEAAECKQFVKLQIIRFKYVFDL